MLYLYLLVFGEFGGILGLGLEHHLHKTKDSGGFTGVQNLLVLLPFCGILMGDKPKNKHQRSETWRTTWEQVSREGRSGPITRVRSQRVLTQQKKAPEFPPVGDDVSGDRLSGRGHQLYHLPALPRPSPPHHFCFFSPLFFSWERKAVRGDQLVGLGLHDSLTLHGMWL